jgi:hypothetical protein
MYFGKSCSWIDEKTKSKQNVYFSFHGDTPDGDPKTDFLTQFIVSAHSLLCTRRRVLYKCNLCVDDDVLYMSEKVVMEVEENWDKVTEVTFAITDTEEEIETKIRAIFLKMLQQRQRRIC